MMSVPYKAKIKIKNFRSLENIELDLSRATLLFGPNGSGKSSFIKLIKFVGNILSEGFSTEAPKVNYRLDKKVNLGRFKDIVTNNDTSRDIEVEFNFNAPETQEIIVDFPIITESRVVPEFRFSPNKIINGFYHKYFSGSLFRIERYFSKYKRIDVSFKLIIGKAAQNKNVKYFELVDNLSGDKIFFDYRNKENSAPNGATISQVNNPFLRDFLNNYSLWNTNEFYPKIFFKKIIALYDSEELKSLQIDDSFVKDLRNFACFYYKFYELFPKVIWLFFNITHVEGVRDIHDLNIKFPTKNSLQKFIDDFAQEKQWEAENTVYDPERDEDVLRLEFDSKIVRAQLELDNPGKESTSDSFFNIHVEVFYRKLFENNLSLGYYKRKRGRGDEIIFADKHGNEMPYKQSSSGMMQLLPLIYELKSYKKFGDSFLCIEQPELHLHPKLQIILAEILFQFYDGPYKGNRTIFEERFIIETHSEHIVRKIQVMVAKSKIEMGDVSFNYFDQDENTGITSIKKMELEDNGFFKEPWPNGFFDEASDLAYALLEAQIGRKN